MWIEDPDGIRIVLVEVPAGHPLRRDLRPVLPPGRSTGCRITAWPTETQQASARPECGYESASCAENRALGQWPPVRSLDTSHPDGELPCEGWTSASVRVPGWSRWRVRARTDHERRRWPGTIPWCSG
jgi:hypothetical protein